MKTLKPGETIRLQTEKGMQLDLSSDGRDVTIKCSEQFGVQHRAGLDYVTLIPYGRAIPTVEEAKRKIGR